MIKKLQNMTHLSPTEQSIATFILNTGERVCYMTIQELAKQTYSSNVAIIRLCKKLDCSGFKDFKIKYLKSFENAKTDMVVDMNRPFYLGEKPHQIVQAMTKVHQQTIQDCMHNIDVQQFDELSLRLMNARRIYIFAVGDSAIRAHSFINKLLKIGIYAIGAMDNHEEYVHCQNATSSDCALFISYSGHQYSFPECIRTLKAKGCPIVSITSEVETILTKNSLINIRVPLKESTADNIGTFYSQISLDYILNTLYALIYSHNYVKNHDMKRAVDQHEHATRIKQMQQ